MALGGKIAKWEIDDTGLFNDSLNDVYLKTIKRDIDGNVVSTAYVGTDGTSTVDAYIAVFRSLKKGPIENKALYAEASGSTLSGGDIAGFFKGDVIIQGGISLLNGDGSEVSFGKSGHFSYEVDGDRYKMVFQNGILIDQGPD